MININIQQITTSRNQVLLSVFILFIVSHYMFRPTCRPSSGVADKITSNGSVTDYFSVDPPSPDIYGIKVLIANAVEIMSKEV
jgi:hypothetical protein